MHQRTLSLFSFILFVALLVWSPFSVSAQQNTNGGFVPVAPGANQVTDNTPQFVTLIPGGGPFDAIFGEGSSLPGFFNSLFTLSITIGALLAVLMIAYSGWLYMTSEIADNKKKAVTQIQNALLGLLMLLATVLILRQINPDIVSLNILSNFSPVSTSQQGALYTDDGLLVSSDDRKGYCYAAVGNANANEYENYMCFDTLTACGQKAGSLNACSPFDIALNDAYGPGNGRDTQLPNGAADYQSRVWISDIGRDSNGNLRNCNVAKGIGWVNLAANMCGSSIGTVTGQCCGLLKTAPATDTPVAPSSIVGEIFSTSEIEFIKPGQWCHLENNTYTCYSTADACIVGSNTTDCIVRVDATTWAYELPKDVIDDKEYRVGSMTAPEGSYCYQIGSSLFCSTEKLTCNARATEKEKTVKLTDYCLRIIR